MTDSTEYYRQEALAARLSAENASLRKDIAELRKENEDNGRLLHRLSSGLAKLMRRREMKYRAFKRTVRDMVGEDRFIEISGEFNKRWQKTREESE